MLGLATKRCSLGRMDVQPVKLKTVSATTPSSVNGGRYCVVLLRNRSLVFIVGIGKRSGEKFYSNEKLSLWCDRNCRSRESRSR